MNINVGDSRAGYNIYARTELGKTCNQKKSFFQVFQLDYSFSFSFTLLAGPKKQS